VHGEGAPGLPADRRDDRWRRRAAPAGNVRLWGRAAVRRQDGTAEAAAVLRASGWRVTTLAAGTGIDAAWRDLHGPGAGLADQRIWRPVVTS
jgi:hypothetical protein